MASNLFGACKRWPALTIAFVALYSSEWLVVCQQYYNYLDIQPAANTPPYFNLARGRKIDASATCGEFNNYLEEQRGHMQCATGGLSSSSNRGRTGSSLSQQRYQARGELYCKLTGANWAKKEEAEHGIRFGQLCDCCYPGDPEHGHPAQYAIDGTEKWWQSPPLSRGYQYEQVNLTIDLGQIFHVAWIMIKMANTPRPEQWILERSADFGVTWQPWQYFAGTARDCLEAFGVLANQTITSDDTALCSTEFSKIVPLENGEILVSLVNGRPGANNFILSDSLRNWTTATHIRLRFQKIKTLMGQYVTRQNDETVTRRYYYSIKDVHIGGRCMCHGHTNTCYEPEAGSNVFYCDCKNNTGGQYCERCREGFVQKRWQPARYNEPFECEPCNCNGHSSSCYFDPLVDEQRKSMDIYGRYEGGGVCTNCRDFTTGINCDMCEDGYYRLENVPADARQPCIPCPCDPRFTTGKCAMFTGKCECRPQYTGGDACDQCAAGYYGFPDCIPCPCSIYGTLNGACLPATGQCVCRPEFTGPRCDQCAAGYYTANNTNAFSIECVACQCDAIGSSSQDCNRLTGQCQCIDGHAGRQCNVPDDGYRRVAGQLTVAPCDCDTIGTTEQVCNKISGVCSCRLGYAGGRCDVCAAGYSGYPNCTECDCDPTGTLLDTSCDVRSGQCQCKSNFGGRNCRQCRPGYFNYPTCSVCECSAFGAIGTSCSNDGSCTCRPGFEGKKCDRCAPLRYNYPRCEECNCNPAGVVAYSDCTTAQKEGELCECKARVEGRTCDRCKPLFFGLTAYNALGCEECGCFTAGTISALRTCAGDTGQCPCKPYVGPTDRMLRIGQANGNGNSITGAKKWRRDATSRPAPVVHYKQLTGSGANARRCSVCRDRFFKLTENDLLGCRPCKCDVGGATYGGSCDKISGKCKCRARITGDRCDRPIAAAYVPSLHQLKFEAEEGRTREFHRTRFGFDVTKFPDYSWRGFANLSAVQPEVLIDVDLPKPGFYQILLRYVNPTAQQSTVNVQFSPDNYFRQGSDVTGQVLLPAQVDGAFSPQFSVVGQVGSQNNISQKFFAETRGPHVVSLKLQPAAGSNDSNVDSNAIELLPASSYAGSELLYVDYVVLLPDAYYEAHVLRQEVYDVCLNDAYVEKNVMTQQRQIPCRKLAYPPLDNFLSVRNAAIGERADQEPQPSEVEFELPITSKEPHAVIVEYFTVRPKSADVLDVEFRSRQNTESSAGSLMVYECPFHMLCRSVITDPDGQAQLFTSTTGRGFIRLVSNSDENGAVITRLIAVPAGNFSNDFVTPGTMCLHLNDKQLCEPVRLPEMPHDMKAAVVEAEAENLFEVPLVNGQPLAGVTSGGTSLRNVDGTLRLTGRVQRPDKYTFVVQYLNRNLPAEEADVVVVQSADPNSATSSTTTGLLKFDFCPSSSGCRTVIQSLNGDSVYSNNKNGGSSWYVDDEFTVTIEARPDADIWIDKLYVIPSDKWRSTFLEELPVSVADRFIDACRASFFDIPNNNNTSVSNNNNNDALCREATFSLAAEFNNGALPCQCNIDGIENARFDCAPLGGQCACKQNIIGRTCSRCRTGYFGFPQCRKCDCPYNALCDENTGQCLCPPGVTGQKCDRCKPNAYGFDPYIGCQPCECNEFGVVDGQRDCDETTGQCRCKQNILSRTCSECAIGFFNFPACYECQCNLGGTLKTICNAQTGTCYCKPFVEGAACEQCKSGSYNLNANNALGCTQCFCFGRSRQCQSSSMFKTQLENLVQIGSSNSSWQLQPAGTGSLILNDDNEIRTGPSAAVVVFKPDIKIPTQASFLDAPQQFTGNQLKSYGGKLRYTITPIPEIDGNENLPLDSDLYDVVLVGGPGGLLRLVHYAAVQPSSGQATEIVVPLVEAAFNYSVQPDVASGIVTRENFMRTLANLTSLRIRATYFTNIREVELSNFQLETARGGNGAGTRYLPAQYNARRLNTVNDTSLATAVEICNCPPAYTGTSCELCADGYFSRGVNSSINGNSRRQPDGECVQCDCNGFSETCDKATGICSNCRFNTIGEHCELCASGFFGDPKIFRGSPATCQPCACPFAEDLYGRGVRSRADGCQLGKRDVICNCREGYVGDRCEECAPTYYGNPGVPGGECLPCQCNNNLDSNDPFACDPENGACLRCANNTAGQHCEQCAPGYYGNALDGTGCRPCSCEVCGTKACGNTTGECMCLSHVEGALCDRCEYAHYGLRTLCGNGCESCECGVASVSRQCNETTGQCTCQPGATGRTCSACKSGYYKLTQDGCLPCQCDSKYSKGTICDQINGQCSCLPGVTGIGCDRCKWRHVLIGNVGCRSCPPCVHQLLDSTDDLEQTVAPALGHFNTSTSRFFIKRRLDELTQRQQKSNSGLDFLRDNGIIGVIGSWNDQLGDLELEAQDRLGKAQSMVNTASRLRNRSGEDIRKTEDVRSSIVELYAKAQATNRTIQNLERSLLHSGGIRLEDYLQNAEQWLDRIDNKNFDAAESSAGDELRMAQEVRVDAENFNNTDRESRLHKLQQRFGRLDARMQDARNLAKNTSKTTQQANEKSAFNDAQLTDSIDYITLLASTIPTVTQNASQATKNAAQLNELSGQDFGYINTQGSLLKTEMENARRHMDAQRFDKGQLEEIVLTNDGYVNNASRQLSVVAATLNPVTQATKAAVAAASAYTTIQNNMVQARNLANEVVNTPQVDANVVGRQKGQAEDMSQGVQRTWDTTMALGPEITAEADRLGRVVQGNLTLARQQANEMQQLVQRLQDRIARTRRTDLLPLAQNYEVSANGALKRASAARAKIDDLAAQVNQLRDEASVLAPKDSNFSATSASTNRANGAANGNLNGNGNGNGEGLAPADMLGVFERSQELASNLQRVQEVEKEKIDAARATMGRIRGLISQARTSANRVPLGIEFGPSSKVQIKTPQNIERTAMFTDLSMYFRTRVGDGLLFYIGNEVGTGRRVRRDYNPVTDDYLTLQIVKGRVQLTYNLGEEDVNIQSDMFVANGEWYFVRVERTAQLAELVVQNSRGEVSRTKGASRGLLSVLDLNPISSAIFAGGMPQQFGAQQSITAKHFIGCIDNVRLFDEPIGLWNFQGVTLARTTATQAQLGGCATPRLFASRISADDARSVGVARFNGRGFARFNNTYLTTGGDGGGGGGASATGMLLNFEVRTFQRDALIFWTGSQDASYISCFFKDGRIILQFDLNMGVAQAMMRGVFNDGEWHRVAIELENRQGALNVDNGQSEFAEAEGDHDSVFRLGEPFLYIAGVEPTKQNAVDLTGIPARGLDGCVRNLEINSQRIDLSRPSLSDGMDRHCPNTLFFVRQISLNATESGGYLKLPSTTLQSNGGSSTNQPFSATLKFKTRQPTGQILTTGNSDLSEILSLYLLDGQLFVAAVNNGAEVGESDAATSPTVVKASSHSNRFHNGEWHYVTIVQDTDRLQMNIDDYEYVTERIGDAARIRQDVTGPLYVGGVPVDALLALNVLRNVQNSFVGCIGDLTINKQPRNMFSDVSENVHFGSECAVAAVDEQWYVNQQQNSRISPVVVAAGDVPRITAQASYVPPASVNIEAIRAKFSTTTTSTTTTTTTRRPTAAVLTTATTERTRAPTIPPPIVIAQVAETIPTTTRTSATASTSSLTTTTTTSSIPVVFDSNQCKAARSRVEIIPPNPTDMYRDKGLLFGASSESRLEYYEPLSLETLLRSGSFSFDLLTRSPNGIILYADGGTAKSDFLTVYVENGILVYSFNPGSGAAVIRSTRLVNDGKWHSIQANRTGVEGELYIDGVLEGKGSSPNAKLQDVNLKHPFYVAGVPRSNAARLNDIRQNLRVANVPSGNWVLVRQLRLNGAEMIAPTFFDVASADNTYSQGVYFPAPLGGENGNSAAQEQYIAPFRSFFVNVSKTITFDIKPQTNTGLILAVRAVDQPDVMIVSLIDGYLHVAVDNGMGLVTAVSKPATRNYFCDGRFHTVKVQKQRNVLSVMVDENPDLSALGIGSGASTQADTNTALYIGGIDRQVAIGMNGLETTTSFVGCIGEVRIDDKQVDFTNAHAVSGRVMGFCPDF